MRTQERVRIATNDEITIAREWRERRVSGPALVRRDATEAGERNEREAAEEGIAKTKWQMADRRGAADRGLGFLDKPAKLMS